MTISENQQKWPPQIFWWFRRMYVRLRFCRENFSSKQPVADSLFTGAQSAILKLSTGICMVCLFSNLSAFMRTHSAPDNLEMQTDAQKVTLFESLFSASGKSSWRKTRDGYNHIKRAHNKEVTGSFNVIILKIFEAPDSDYKKSKLWNNNTPTEISHLHTTHTHPSLTPTHRSHPPTAEKS